ncbi:MAG: VOC family protein [Gammaproteobacteria bacterium]|nr:VOC family protein [Gammaproteobacteria bacterium]
MPTPIPYLSFDGNCAEAMRFYERTLSGKLELLMRNADSPFAAQVPPEHADRIIHARLALPGGGYLYAGDCPPQMKHAGIHGVALTLNFDTVAQATAVFEALADGGTVTMAQQPMFWAKTWGMLTDRFGTPWIVNGELQAVYASA